MPTILSEAQRKAVYALFQRNNDKAKSYLCFRRRFHNFGDFIGGTWCDMFIGIEKDGYTHS